MTSHENRQPASQLAKWVFNTESLGRLAKAGLKRGPTERDVYRVADLDQPKKTVHFT